MILQQKVQGRCVLIRCKPLEPRDIEQLDAQPYRCLEIRLIIGNVAGIPDPGRITARLGKQPDTQGLGQTLQHLETAVRHPVEAQENRAPHRALPFTDTAHLGLFDKEVFKTGNRVVIRVLPIGRSERWCEFFHTERPSPEACHFMWAHLMDRRSLARRPVFKKIQTCPTADEEMPARRGNYRLAMFLPDKKIPRTGRGIFQAGKPLTSCSPTWRCAASRLRTGTHRKPPRR